MSEQAKPAHSRFGGSVIGRVIGCPGSVALTATLPPKVETQYMVEGTMAHDFAQYMLTEGERDALRYIGEAYPFESRALKKLHDLCGARYLLVDRDMAKAVQVYLDAVYAVLDSDPAAELYVEQTFTLPVGENGEVFGSCDALVYLPAQRKVVCFDYKHGAGKSVAVEDNAQPKFYATGAVVTNPWPLVEIECVIVQPRGPDALEDHGGVKRWTFPVEEVLEFLGQVDEAVRLAKENETPDNDGRYWPPMLKTGEWCKSTWCPAQTICPAKQQEIIDAMGIKVGDIAEVTPAHLPDPATMTPEWRVKVMAAAALLKSWVGQIEEFEFNQAMAGNCAPGFKLVDKQARRKWIAADQTVIDFLAMAGVAPEDAAPPTLVGITEAEKLLRAAAGSAKEFAPLKDALSLQCTIKESRV